MIIFIIGVALYLIHVIMESKIDARYQTKLAVLSVFIWLMSLGLMGGGAITVATTASITTALFLGIGISLLSTSKLIDIIERKNRNTCASLFAALLWLTGVAAIGISMVSPLYT